MRFLINIKTQQLLGYLDSVLHPKTVLSKVVKHLYINWREVVASCEESTRSGCFILVTMRQLVGAAKVGKRVIVLCSHIYDADVVAATKYWTKPLVTVETAACVAARHHLQRRKVVVVLQ